MFTRITNLQRVLPGEGFVTAIAWIRLHSPVYPLMPLQIMIPRKCRGTLIALVRLLRRPLLGLEHHAIKVSPIHP